MKKVDRNFVTVLIGKFCELQFRRADFTSESNFNFFLGAIVKHLKQEFFYVGKSVKFCWPTKIRH
jgi:hypothetical protein